MDELEEGDILEIVDPEGDEYQLQVVEFLNISDQDYVICTPPDAENEAFAFRMLADEEGAPYLEEITDDDEWESVARAWQVESEEQ